MPPVQRQQVMIVKIDFQRRIEQLNGSRRRNRFASDDVSRTKQAREEDTKDKIKASSHLSPWTNDAKRAINSDRLAVIPSKRARH